LTNNFKWGGFMGLILLIVLLLLLAGSVPSWPHSAGWGYRPAGLVSLLLLVLLVLLILQVLPWGFGPRAVIVP
jgi:Protein of unknown function (DUF3309)